MNNWCICWLLTHIFTGISIFKGLTARRLYKSFGVKGLIFNFFSGRGKPRILNQWIGGHYKCYIVVNVLLSRDSTIDSTLGSTIECVSMCSELTWTNRSDWYSVVLLSAGECACCWTVVDDVTNTSAASCKCRWMIVIRDTFISTVLWCRHRKRQTLSVWGSVINDLCCVWLAGIDLHSGASIIVPSVQWRMQPDNFFLL
jgi:hypothetical protein